MSLRRYSAGRCAGGEDEMAGRVDSEGHSGPLRSTHARRPSNLPIVGIDGEPGDVVVLSIADIEESPQTAPVGSGYRCCARFAQRKRRDCPHRQEGTLRTVQTIAGDTTA